MIKNKHFCFTCWYSEPPQRRPTVAVLRSLAVLRHLRCYEVIAVGDANVAHLSYFTTHAFLGGSCFVRCFRLPTSLESLLSLAYVANLFLMGIGRYCRLTENDVMLVIKHLDIPLEIS